MSQECLADPASERFARYRPGVALSSGFYSLIGVAVGGGGTWLTQWRLAARADRLDARVARRKVQAELRRHRQHTEFLVQHHEMWQASPHVYAEALEQGGSNAWAEHSDRLARQLSDPDWDAVEKAYDSIATVVLLKDGGVPIHIGEIEGMLRKIENAIKRLD